MFKEATSRPGKCHDPRSFVVFFFNSSFVLCRETRHCSNGNLNEVVSTRTALQHVRRQEWTRLHQDSCTAAAAAAACRCPWIRDALPIASDEIVCVIQCLRQMTHGGKLREILSVNHVTQSKVKTVNCNKSGQRSHASAKENMVRIRSPFPDRDFGCAWLPKFNRYFLVQGYICDEIFIKIRSLSPEISAKLWENALSCNIEESLK